MEAGLRICECGTETEERDCPDCGESTKKLCSCGSALAGECRDCKGEYQIHCQDERDGK